MKKRTMFTMLTAAAITAAMMSSTMSASAVSIGANGVVTTEETSLTFNKDIVVHNEDTTVASVSGPTITYTYGIAAATVGEGTTVTDANGNATHVKAGIPTAVAFDANDKTAEFTGTAVPLENGKGVATDGVTLNFTPSAFGAAGIYRYKITESASSDLTEASITRDDTYSADRYLDVYVKNTETGLQIAGYVMFHDSDSTISFDAAANPKVNVEKKTDGYDADDDTTASSSTQNGGNMADHYYTYNYDLKKVIAGDLADKTHQFDFAIDTSGSTATYAVTKSAASATAPATGTVGTPLLVSLADQGTVKLIGLPANTKVLVTETNNTSDKYKTDIVFPTVAQATVDKNGTIAFAQTDLTNYGTNQKTQPTKTPALGTQTIFTNTLDSISPTGVVMMVAPYAIMLAAAGFFILVFLKNRRKDESAGTI